MQAKNPTKNHGGARNPGKNLPMPVAHSPGMQSPDGSASDRPEIKINRAQNGGHKPYNLGLNVTPDDTPLWTLCRSTHVRLRLPCLLLSPGCSCPNEPPLRLPPP